ncbi:MAG: MgtC/SapB family protein [Burkholderiaceae bacterium]|nr:MgtC/SapB family protein [Burkholderiaceae bacterium]MCD8515818.1 MgtC/SapB family protein [Burkholderiaceae bacterium]MCD8536182.1 MgtC/SapB family protein [Burkholderiaceae bacterium]MCD8564152.1 MgtC/SapB family protein [Burkholderiaceae bacterium]
MDAINLEIDAYLPGLAVALAIGLLIGAEREWSQRFEKTERVMAGIRTFGLLGLLGALAVVLTDLLGSYAWVAILLAVAMLVVAGYLAEAKTTGDWGMTTEVAMLITFGLGLLAVSGKPVLAAALGVLVAGLLSLKHVLHTQVHRLEPKEVSGALKLLFISVVMLPVLPNRTMGPLDIFNPYVVWWMVVAITGLGFVAYVSIRVAGQRSGVLLTSLLGGLVSSTAMTLTLARLAQKLPAANTLSAGLLLTSALMFPRVLVVSGLLAPMLVPALLGPMLVATAIYLFGAVLLTWRAGRSTAARHQELDTNLQNPFEIGSALRFTVLLVAIMFAVELARRYLGDSGVWVMAAISGAADVDAITLSLARLVGTDITAALASQGILIAAVSNSLLKLALACSIGGKEIAWRVTPFVVAAILSVAALMALTN